jgi:hypothetical protein
LPCRANTRISTLCSCLSIGGSQKAAIVDQVVHFYFGEVGQYCFGANKNGADESFNGKFRDECLSLEWFRSRAEARVVIENWRRHYNAVRPHSSLAYLTPNEFKQQHQPLPNRAVFQE